MGVSRPDEKAFSQLRASDPFRAAMVTAAASEYASVNTAAKILGLSTSRVEQLCRRKVFKTAHKPGFGKQAHWRILRIEVVAHKFNGHVGVAVSQNSKA